MNNIKSIDKDVISETDSDLVNILLFGSIKYEYHINSKIFNFGRSTLAGQRPMKSLSSVGPSVCPSVRLSVRPSLSFLKIGSLVFSNIVHDNS